MSKGKYPRLGNVKMKKGINQECEACSMPATHHVWVEFSYMRGEDDFYRACDSHAAIAKQNLRGFFAHVKKKTDAVLQLEGAL